MGSLVMEPADIESYARIYHPGENMSRICVPLGMINSKGLFHGTNPFDYSVPLLLAQLGLASSSVLITHSFLKPIGQPTVVIQILAGLLLGPSFLGRAAGFTSLVYPFNSLVLLDTLAVFGNMIYFFLIGVQLDPWILKGIRRRDVVAGISSVLLAMIFSIPAALILMSDKLYGGIDSEISSSLPAVAVGSSMIGFPIVAQYLTELRLVNSEFGRMALSTSLVSSLFGFCSLAAMVTASEQGDGLLQNMEVIVTGTIFALAMAFLVRPFILWELRKNPEGEPLKQGFIYMLLVGVLATGFCSKALGLNIFFGPLVYGIAIPAGPPLGSAMVEKLDLINSWLFMPLYFVKNGLVTDIFSVSFDNYYLVQSVILLACTGKFLGAFISSIISKVPLQDAIQIGLVMNVQGVMELGLFKYMKQRKAIHEEPFVVMCLSMLIVTASVTPIVRRLYNPLRRHTVRKRRTIMDQKPDSELRIVACVQDRDNVPTFIQLIETLHPTKRSPIDVCLIHFVKLVGRAHPILIAHKLNRSSSGKASTSRSIINAFKLFQQSNHGVITVHPFTAITAYESMHDEVCEKANDRRASLIITPFHQRIASAGVVESFEAGIKVMNDNILAMAPCTVAIIVDRGPIRTTGRDIESCSLRRVAVFFIGGHDDREALAIGARMASQPNVNLTIIRVLANTNNAADETKIDNDVMNEILHQMAGNLRMMYVEEVVGDGTEIAALIRNVEDRYELILVGRYHDPRSPLLLGISAWGEEDSGLGAVGDMFALADSGSSSTILVVQQRNDSSHGGHHNMNENLMEEPTVPLRMSAA